MDPRALLYLLLSLCFGLFLMGWAHAETITGRASVIDGDTLESAGKRIRLYGADAPRAHRHAQMAAQPSTAADGIVNLTLLRAHSTGSATSRLRIFNGLDP
jgi:hypothetical protein